jgi:hypothetical protein
MDESGSEDDRASSDRYLTGLTRDIGFVEFVADGCKALARAYASNSDSESWADVDLASTLAVLEVWVSLEVLERSGASLGAVVTSIDGALLTDEKRGIAMRWDLVGSSLALMWDRREVVLSSTRGRYGVSASS